jgi:outer membrane lipoprotein SlyB
LWREVILMGRALSVAAAAILIAATSAWAGDPAHRRSGRIQSVDMMSHVITLDDGSVYKVARGVNIKRMKAGQRVTLTTSAFGGTIEASAVTLVLD